ncbi:DgyrCDS14599 [Dimorphilus gyrociliatus]|uniref:DgyrCDS14599 n=1 Tax=Dimorphilus gyrociliatus TaxID=2664684 RepID=A0A7I8WEJ0_9ANNE|nr:DgyrCDS14599 [Dimorphilus gyrociliatus]
MNEDEEGFEDLKNGISKLIKISKKSMKKYIQSNMDFSKYVHLPKLMEVIKEEKEFKEILDLCEKNIYRKNKKKVHKLEEEIIPQQENNTTTEREIDQSTRPVPIIATEEIPQTSTIADNTIATTLRKQTAITTTSDEEIIEAAARAEAATTASADTGTTLQISDCNAVNYTQMDIGLLEELGINLEIGQEIEMEEINEEEEEEEEEIVDKFYIDLQKKNERKIEVGNMLIVQRTNNIIVDTGSLNIIDKTQKIFLRKVKPQFTNVTDYTILTDQFIKLGDKKWEKVQSMIKTEKKIQIFCIEDLKMDDSLPIITGWKLITSNLFIYLKNIPKDIDIKKIVKQLPFSKNNLCFTKKTFDKEICQNLKVMGCKLLNHPNEIFKKEETLVIRLLKELMSAVKCYYVVQKYLLCF